MVFLFGILVGLSLNNNSEFNSNENSITLVNSLRGGEKPHNTEKSAFMQPPPVPDKKYSGEQSTKSQDFREMPPKFGYRTELAGVNEFPDNLGGDGGNFNDNNIPPKSEWEINYKYWDNYKYDPNSFKNTKKEEECELEQKVEEEFNVSNAIEDLIATALKNQDVKNEYTRVIKRLKEGVNPVNIGQKSVLVAKDIVLIKGKHGRYLVKVSGGVKKSKYLEWLTMVIGKI